MAWCSSPGTCATARAARRLVGDLRAESPELLIGIDEEGGDVTRLEVTTGSSYPGSFALGQLDDIELTRGIARELGSDLAEVGIDLDLAPIADVNSDPENPVIGIRSFGASAELVARHVAAFVEGLQETGVAACAKHFPGHGETRVDSHHDLPVIDVDPSTLRGRELVPFAAAVEAGVRSIMTAHIVVPSIAPEPATLSRAHLTGLLRDELGFDGLIVTDALEMAGVAATVGMEEGAVLALAAGADALCLGSAIDAGHVARRPRRRSWPRSRPAGSRRHGSPKPRAGSRRSRPGRSRHRFRVALGWGSRPLDACAEWSATSGSTVRRSSSSSRSSRGWRPVRPSTGWERSCRWCDRTPVR